MDKQPEALWLADELKNQYGNRPLCMPMFAAAELRRLHEVNTDLLAALKRYLEAGVGNSTHFGVQHEAYSKARAAIAKATGEQK